MMNNESNLPEHNFGTDRYAATGPSQPWVQQQTPPTSDIGSPDLKIEERNIDSEGVPDLQGIPYLVTPPSKGSPIRLPSLDEFDRGVEALARWNGRRSDRSLSFLLPTPSQLVVHGDGKHVPPTRLLWSSWNRPDEDSSTECSVSQQQTVTGLGISYSGPGHAYQNLQGNHPYDAADWQFTSQHRQLTASFLRSPSPDVKYSHNSQQYTTEEGDFIIYARHDKKLKWSHVEQGFAAQFGRSPKRTVQGLQAWHYRMNDQIPVWDENGWLCFDSEDGDKPRQTSIKSRDLKSQWHPMEPLGIAQRYPERAVNYTWVDPKTKLEARDWAAKRSLQYEIRDRRRRKQLRRSVAVQEVK